MEYYRNVARQLVREAEWVVFNGTMQVVNDRVLAYVHVTSDDRAQIVVPRRFGEGLRRELVREVRKELRRTGPLKLYRRLVSRHLVNVATSLRWSRTGRHAVGSGEWWAKVEVRDDAILVSLLGRDRCPFALTLEFPLRSDRVYVRDSPSGDRILALGGELAEVAKFVLRELAEAGIEPRCTSSGF